MLFREKAFRKIVVQALIYGIAILCVVTSVNYSVDASSVISAKSHTEMARIALSGETVAVPENYNERVYQVAILEAMNNLPDTVVIGGSRGMFLGEEITGYENLYNNCVSGATLEDYYALCGMYYHKFSVLPKRIIVETSPWVFYAENPDMRWTENNSYRSASLDFYKYLNGRKKKIPSGEGENPFLSMAYFQYNRDRIKQDGLDAFEEVKAKVSNDEAEAADYSDGSIRYAVNHEKPNPERLANVKSTKGAVTYQNVNLMTELDPDKIKEYERLLEYLIDNGSEIIIYLQPFSVTQCEYIYDKGENLVFIDVADYLEGLGDKYDIEVVGGYDARDYGLTDESFIDYMHLDKKGTKSVWNA